MNTTELIESVIQRIAVGPDRSKDISFDEAKQLARAFLNDQLSDDANEPLHDKLNEPMDEVQFAVILIALRMKRETEQEFRGLAQGVQDTVKQHDVQVDNLLQLADPFDGYLRHLPMSPFLPAVLAACDVPAVMCGVHSVGPKHGVTAHKVLLEAGINTRASLAQAAQQIETIGWAYVDMADYCPSLYAMNDIRNRIIKRTALTTLERVLMPFKAKQQTSLVLGYVHRAYPEIYAAIAEQLGFSQALLVKGVEGGLMPAINKPLRRYRLNFQTEAKNDQASSHDITTTNSQTNVNERKEVLSELPFADAPQPAVVAEQQSKQAVAENVHLTLGAGLAALAGEQGVAYQSLCWSAANILQSYQIVSSIDKAVEKVQECLDNGHALRKFNQAIEQ